MLENIPSIPHPKALEERFPDAAPEALDLMRKLLHFNPNKRLTVEVCFVQ
jgi:mitogen-activated protein kinase 15